MYICNEKERSKNNINTLQNSQSRSWDKERRRKPAIVNLERQKIERPRSKNRERFVMQSRIFFCAREISTSRSRGSRLESFQDLVSYPVPSWTRYSDWPHGNFNLIPNGDVSSCLSLGSLDLPASSEMCKRSIDYCRRTITRGRYTVFNREPRRRRNNG